MLVVGCRQCPGSLAVCRNRRNVVVPKAVPQEGNGTLEKLDREIAKAEAALEEFKVKIEKAGPKAPEWQQQAWAQEMLFRMRVFETLLQERLQARVKGESAG
ncbi:hypothetical protein GPECTOR_13g693 [Gonium pectorale]|uniref:Uncharacterized protein n=1 Tax=Gonium pectorale TaxID=33097 RepID=A0A150GMW1_GONPE|nr:hypothetical protein GPECTOR_13g693 [Gonium pectorale]|eukprot:KXZ51206.1 hypothetical protein GPECTOR_13g693 [Gonium pectorale]